ncbi:transposable element Tc3 transposase [Trichonephila clavipes]|nr:transposable element Tc3 transposase [Trichonephila clavipes]
MNCDDSDLSSLSYENDYQGDKRSEMDDDDEHQDIQYSKYTHIRLTDKPSPTPSLAEDETDEPNQKRRVTTCVSHQAAHDNEATHIPEMVEDRNHRSRCRNKKCTALTTVNVQTASDEAHFWLNGYVNKQNCHIWSEANPQAYVETPLHPEKLTVWCALWAGGILLQKR